MKNESIATTPAAVCAVFVTSGGSRRRAGRARRGAAPARSRASARTAARRSAPRRP